MTGNKFKILIGFVILAALAITVISDTLPAGERAAPFNEPDDTLGDGFCSDQEMATNPNHRDCNKNAGNWIDFISERTTFTDTANERYEVIYWIEAYDAIGRNLSRRYVMHCPLDHDLGACKARFRQEINDSINIIKQRPTYETRTQEDPRI